MQNQHLNWVDLDRINTWARLYARDGNQDTLQAAAEYYSLAITARERERIVYWWHEGCRDYATDMKHLSELEESLLVASLSI